MKLDLTFAELAQLREAMNAPLSNWTGEDAELGPREALLNALVDGLEIDLDEITVGPGRLLTYSGEQVILYIKDTRSSLETLQREPERTRRFHVAECSTLEEMRRQNRFERYVVTRRTDGKFLVDWQDPVTREKGETEAALFVCRNCLRNLNWRGYETPGQRNGGPHGNWETKDEIWRSFTISDFLLEYSTFFNSLPSRRDVTAGIDRYVNDWSLISMNRRREVNWRCQICRVDLSQYPRLLHCHHKNGVISDNLPSNLQVLCALCHASQPGHGHMHIPDTDRRTVLRLRGEQRLSC